MTEIEVSTLEDKEFKGQFPSFSLEDKATSPGECIVTKAAKEGGPKPFRVYCRRIKGSNRN